MFSAFDILFLCYFQNTYKILTFCKTLLLIFCVLNLCRNFTGLFADSPNRCRFNNLATKETLPCRSIYIKMENCTYWAELWSINVHQRPKNRGIFYNLITIFLTFPFPLLLTLFFFSSKIWFTFSFYLFINLFQAKLRETEWSTSACHSSNALNCIGVVGGGQCCWVGLFGTAGNMVDRYWWILWRC